MRRIRRRGSLLAVFLLLGIGLLGCGSRQETVTEDHKKETAKKEVLTESAEITEGDLKLALNIEDATISVTDSAVGNVWSSNPPLADTDPTASGEYKTKIKSQLYITYTNKDWKEKNTNSYVGCIKDGTFTCYAIENGYRIEYDFATADIMIPVEYTLQGRRLSASVVLSEIEEDGNNLLNEVTLLPFFGTASSEDEGILLIPDGSGAVIEMNNGKTGCQDYAKRYYGEDAAYTQTTYSTDTQKLLLPVFGMVKNNGAFLARISSGAELATLNASVSGKYTSYNTICTTVEYRGVDRDSALKNDSNSGYAYLPERPVALERYAVDYIFADSMDPSYSDLAALYRKELLEKLSLNEEDTALQNRLYIDLYGGLSKKKAFLGIVYNGKAAVTTYEQMQMILEDLCAAAEQPLTVRMLHYSESEFSKKAGRAVTPVSFLGNKKSYRSLTDYCKEHDITLYATADINSFRKSGNGFSIFRDVVSDMTKQSVLTARYDVKSGKTVVNKNSEYLMTQNALLKSAKKTAELMESYQIDGVSLTGDSLRLYSDFGKACTGRDEMKDTYEEGFQNIAEKGKLSFEQAFEYMLPYATEIVNVPISSGGHQLFDYDVPFYQMAIMGIVGYSGNSYNTVNPTRDYFLCCAETLTAMKYTLGYDETELIGQEDSELHNIHYDELKDTILDYSRKMHELCSAVSGARMVDFYRIDGVSVGIYDNSTVVYTNHNEQEYRIDGILIPAMDIVIDGGDR